MKQVNTDNALECIREDIAPVQLNIVVAGEYIGDIKRSNRSLKEGTRCEIHNYPYQWYPREIVKGCVTKVTKDNNDLPLNDGLSGIYGPGTLVKGTPIPDYNCLKTLSFGNYVQAKQPVNPTNSSEARTIGAIVPYPSGNAQGSWYFMSIATGERIHRYEWTKIPITRDTIDAIHRMAQEKRIPEVNGNFTYEAMPGEEIGYGEDDNTSEDVEMVNLIKDNDQFVDQIDNDSSSDNEEHDEEQVEDVDQGVDTDIVEEIDDGDDQITMEDGINGAAADENDTIGDKLQLVDDIGGQHIDVNKQAVGVKNDDDDVPIIHGAVGNEDTNNDIIEPLERATHGYGLRSALREARHGRDTHRNRYEREFQYMQASVKEIRKELGERKKTKLNVCDEF